MSRSKRSEPARGIAGAESDKEWKRHANRRLRRAATQIVQRMPSGDPDAVVLPVMNEVANLYGSPKEGKHWFGPDRSPEMMRK